jgi:hypothetical protein
MNLKSELSLIKMTGGSSTLTNAPRAHNSFCLICYR